MVDSARQVRCATYPVWVYSRDPSSVTADSGLPALIRDAAVHFANRIAAAGDDLLRADAAVATAGPGDRRHTWPGAGFLFQQHLGMYGICKTLVGYFSASIGMQFDVEHAFVRLVLCFIFYLFHQFFYWVLQRSLLDQPAVFEIQTELILGAVNARDRRGTVSLPRQTAQAGIGAIAAWACPLGLPSKVITERASAACSS